jgi:hypothetical protein
MASSTQYEPTGVIPETVDEALAAWDAGEAVQTIEMGGIGLGYEMAIQCVAFELMRALRDDHELRRINKETEHGGEFPKSFRNRLDKIITDLDAEQPDGSRKLGGLSGAQAGAAKNIALNLTRHGYDNARSQVPDRLIFVRRQDPVSLYRAEKATA